jgi:hypothetical protein
MSPSQHFVQALLLEEITDVACIGLLCQGESWDDWPAKECIVEMSAAEFGGTLVTLREDDSLPRNRCEIIVRSFSRRASGK